jgi:hypothetical protein
LLQLARLLFSRATFEGGVMIKTPDWDIWRQIPQAELWKWVALSCGIEPKSTSLSELTKTIHNPIELPVFSPQHFPNKSIVGPKKLDQFRDRLKIAIANLESDLLYGQWGGPAMSSVPLLKFVKLVRSLDWDNLPDEFEQISQQREPNLIERKAFNPNSETDPPGNSLSLRESPYWKKLKSKAERAILEYPNWRKEQKRVQKTSNLQDWLVETIEANTREAEILKKVLSDLFSELK